MVRALDGLWEVVNNETYGGARHISTAPGPDGRAYEPIFNLPGVVVWGKTGTAQEVGPNETIVYSEDGSVVRGDDGRPVIHTQQGVKGTHSWFNGLVGRAPAAAVASGRKPGPHDARPEYVVTVFVQWGGSGSRCAGPIANQIMHALAEEGYLSPEMASR